MCIWRLLGFDRASRAAKIVAAGKRLAMQKRDAEAMDAFREAIRLAPEFAEAHCLLGVSLMGEGVGAAAGKNADAERLEAAAAAFREAVRLEPRAARAHGHLGEVLNALERHPEAVAALEECRRLDPAHFDSVQSFRRRLECALAGRRWDGVR